MTKIYELLPEAKSPQEFKKNDLVRVFMSDGTLEGTVFAIANETILVNHDDITYGFHFRQIRKLKAKQPKVYWMKREVPSPSWIVRATPPIPKDHSNWIKVQEVHD